ncbi:FabD/lysophospholipase-like protein [Mycena venus]|uniref:FabD/lysophospholipase-like protein n=1 Tax=Mycena venus TaxID=2733690 RepID=A0A8H6XQ12_9AGAR|nr:FabD/lysophospholipase-like protein [Mycena venus]
MSAWASESHTINNHIYGGVGGNGGAGRQQGGGGGAGEGSRINWAVEAENFTMHNHIQIHGSGSEQKQQMNASEIKQSKAALALVRCPPPSQIFQGRQDILEKMKEYFSRNLGERHIYVLYGLGGSGKTQIALKFLNMMNRYQTPRFTKQFFINASSLQTLNTAFKNIAISQRIGNTSEDGLLWLISEIEEWMLLFDNADDPTIDLFPFFPRCTHGNIIITSRNPQLAEHGPRSHSRVGDMDETDAIDLLLLRAVKEKTIEITQRASEIVKELSYLPLAIIQADSLILDTGTIKSMFWKQYAWIYYDSGRFNEAEPLEQLVLKRQKQLLGADHPDTLLAMANLAATYRQLGRYQEAEPLQGIVLEKRKQVLGADHPDTLRAMGNLAATYHQLGRYQEAEPLEGIVLEKRKQVLGADHPDTLLAMANLAGTYRQLGRYQEAEPLEGTVLEKRKQVLGADHPDTQWAMANLAATYRRLGRYQEAEPLDGIVLEKRKQVLGADHPDTLRAMGNLAATYHQLGRYQEAEPLQGIVLEKQKKVLGADHPDTLQAMAKLAATYHQLGRYQEEEPLEGTVLEKRKKVLGADHPDTLQAMANLAATYH